MTNLVESIKNHVEPVVRGESGGALYLNLDVEVNIYLDKAKDLIIPTIELEFQQKVNVYHMLNVANTVIVELQEGPLDKFSDLELSVHAVEKDSLLIIEWHGYKIDEKSGDYSYA